MRKIIESCPSCSDELLVTELRCVRCETVIRGRYRPSLFDRLAEKDLRFVEAFVLSKGNVKEMERDLGVSYWSIRNRLTEVVERLQLEALPASGDLVVDDEVDEARQAILAELAAGQIDAAEAARRLAAL
jgi:hypothetical protein